jgi:glycosyltransferase involved in cell wall biosynthesis
MKPVKVLHIVNVDKENYYLNNLCDYSDTKEVEFLFATFASADCDFARDMEKRGKQVFALDCLKRSEYPQAFGKLWKILKKENPDIVHTHLFDPTVIGLTVAKWQKRKAIFTRHHSDALYEVSSPAKRKFYLKLEKYINRKSDHIIAPSQMVRDILVEKESVAPEKVSLIPYGQTTERFELITPEKIEKVKNELDIGKNLALVCVSRLFHRKGHIYLFEAFAGLVKKGLDATLYLVGTGDYQTALEKMAKDLQIDNQVKFLGWRNDALTIIAAADIIVHPSLEDALSSAVIESLMLEKPIIATDISGVCDSLDDGKYGKIVPPADAESFAKALAETIENFEVAREKARQGKKYLLEYMSAERVANMYGNVYRKILETI